MDGLIAQGSFVVPIVVNHSGENKKYNIEVQESTKISEIMSEFSEQLNLDNRQGVQFKYGSHILKPMQTIKGSGLQKGSQIELEVITHGGQTQTKDYQIK